MLDTLTTLNIDLNKFLYDLPVYWYFKNLKSEYIGCSKMLAELSGLNSPEDIIGKTDYDFNWGTIDADKFVADDQYVISTGQTHESEYLMPVKTSEYCMIIRTTKQPLYNKDGIIVGIFAVARDISDDIASILSFMQRGFTDKYQFVNDNYRDTNLTRTEYSILYLLKVGKSSKEIAQFLSMIEGSKISAETVNLIIRNTLFPKFNASTIGSLIEQAASRNSTPYLPLYLAGRN